MPLDFQLISGSPLVLDVLGIVEATWIALHIGQQSIPNFDRLGRIPSDQPADRCDTEGKIRPRPCGQPLKKTSQGLCFSDLIPVDVGLLLTISFTDLKIGKGRGSIDIPPGQKLLLILVLSDVETISFSIRGDLKTAEMDC